MGTGDIQSTAVGQSESTSQSNALLAAVSSKLRGSFPIQLHVITR